MGKSVCIGVTAVLFVCIWGAACTNELKCTGDTYYKVKTNGKAFCKTCPACKGGGLGWNTTAIRIEDGHGFRSCYPCAKCSSGTYRMLDSDDSKCRSCTLDCLRLNRYGSVSCGGASPGHCGECMTWYKADSKEPNSMCTIKTTEGTRKVITVQPEVTFETKASRFEPSTSGEDDNKPHEESVSNPLANLPAWIPAGVLLFLILILLILAVYAGKRSHNRNGTRADLGIVIESGTALITSGSSIGEDNLEIDGIEKVRGERPEHITMADLVAMVDEYDVPKPPRDIKCVKTYYDRVLEKDDETLNIVANKISGERRHELFQTYLGIEKSKSDPEEEKWLKHIISFPEYILEVLKKWLNQADKEATLKALCHALKLASFDKVVDVILDLPENQIPVTNS